jgi:hypothetical protein
MDLGNSGVPTPLTFGSVKHRAKQLRPGVAEARTSQSPGDRLHPAGCHHDSVTSPVTAMQACSSAAFTFAKVEGSSAVRW